MASRRARDFDRWVRLGLRPGDGGLFVDYVDEAGTRLTADPPPRVGPRRRSLTLWRDTPKYVPERLAARLHSGFADLPETRPHWLPNGKYLRPAVPWLLPVFVDPPEGTSHLPWEDWLSESALQGAELANRCVLMRHVKLRFAPALELPLRFEQLGTGATDWFSTARARGWYADSDAVRQFGLQFADPGEDSVTGRAQVVLRPFGTELPSGLLSSFSSVPLLVVTIAETLPSALSQRESAPEPGVSHLLVHPRDSSAKLDAKSVVEQIVYALVHDFALHQIVWILRHVMPKARTWGGERPGRDSGDASLRRDATDCRSSACRPRTIWPLGHDRERCPPSESATARWRFPI